LDGVEGFMVRMLQLGRAGDDRQCSAAMGWGGVSVASWMPALQRNKRQQLCEKGTPRPGRIVIKPHM
jgi:hypothetical protein